MSTTEGEKTLRAGRTDNSVVHAVGRLHTCRGAAGAVTSGIRARKIDEHRRPAGVVHLHELVGAGLGEVKGA
jgi:hypothetical protein